ncbi:hypothetical protein D1P53_004941 [Cryptococcus gattii VGV]|nr:hypothetical protein D1P53_004941 [Cryptococcus gattii VGV]
MDRKKNTKKPASSSRMSDKDGRFDERWDVYFHAFLLHETKHSDCYYCKGRAYKESGLVPTITNGINKEWWFPENRRNEQTLHMFVAASNLKYYNLHLPNGKIMENLMFRYVGQSDPQEEWLHDYVGFTTYNIFTDVFSLLLSETPRPHCAMYEPHLVDLANQHSHGDHEGMSLLEELDKIAPIKSFDAFPKTHFDIGKATSIKNNPSSTTPSASEIISSSRRRTPNQQSSFSGIKRLFTPSSSSNRRTAQGHTAYRPTYDKVQDGPACRIYGSVQVKKVTANLHITTLGHGYMSFQHTDHHLMNLSHVVHEFSFGPFFPAIAQPLDQSYEITLQPFTIFQYFLRVVPTTYIDASRRKLITSQYAVTDYSRSFEHGKGVPGLFFKYDLEPMSVVIRERTTSLFQFLIRLAGVVGGVWTVAAFALRVFNRATREVSKAVVGEKEYIPSSLHTPSPAMKREQSGSGYFANDSPSTLVSRATSWVSGNNSPNPGGNDLGNWKSR